MLLVIAAAAGLAGCNILDVENPNQVVEDELEDPTTAGAQANGVVASVARALQTILTPYSTVSDELTWIGSREGYRQLDAGAVSDPYNEFTDADFL